MKYTSLLFIWLGALGLAAARANVTGAVVKVVSYPCDRPRDAKLGSGTLLRIDGKLYILSSDHVVYHGSSSEGICHKYLAGDGQERPAELEAVNFGRGLSLLRSAQAPANLLESAVAFESIEKRRDETEEGFGTLAGYPFASISALKDARAEVADAQSNRTVLPLVHRVIEVSGHNEYGMSGGAYFNEHGEYAGLLSHQYLRTVVGKPSELYEADSGMVAGNLLGLVIPLPEIVDWLSPLAHGGQSGNIANLKWDLASQIRGKTEAVLGGLRFTPRTCTDSPQLAVFGNPWGVGGEMTVEGKVCEVVLSLAPDNPAWPFRASSQLVKAKDRLSAGNHAAINGLLYKGQRIAIGTLVNLFNLLQAGAVPLIRLEGPFLDTNDTVRELSALADGIQGLTLKLEAAFPDDRQTQEFLSGIGIYATLLRNKQFDLVDLDDLKHTLDGKEWTLLMVDQWQDATALKADLWKMRELLGRLLA